MQEGSIVLALRADFAYPSQGEAIAKQRADPHVNVELKDDSVIVAVPDLDEFRLSVVDGEEPLCDWIELKENSTFLCKRRDKRTIIEILRRINIQLPTTSIVTKCSSPSHCFSCPEEAYLKV